MEDTAVKQINEALERIEKAMQATEAGNKEQLASLSKKQEELSRELLDIQQKGVKMAETKPEVKSVGATFTESEAFKSYVSGGATKARVEIPEVKAAVDPMLTPTDGSVAPYRRPGVLAGAFRPLTVEALLPSIPISTNAFEYTQEKSFTNGAAFVKEGAQKPFSSVEFELKQGTVQTIAALARVSKQMLADAPALTAYINTRMVYGVDLAVEDQIVSGNGTVPNLSGLLTAGNYTAHGAKLADLGGSDATLFDLLLFAKTKVENAFFRPSQFIMNPADWATLMMQKNKSGDYYLGLPASVAPKTLWGIPVVTSPAIPEGKFLVGDFTQAATLWVRSGIVVEMFEQDQDNVQKNLVTIRAERRLGLGVERPLALVGGDLVLPTA